MLFVEDENGNHILDENGNKITYKVTYENYKGPPIYTPRNDTY